MTVLKSVILTVGIGAAALAAFICFTKEQNLTVSVSALSNQIRGQTSARAFAEFEANHSGGESRPASVVTTRLKTKFSLLGDNPRTISEIVDEGREGLALLDYIDPARLSSCDRILYYKYRAFTERQLAIFESMDTDQNAASIYAQNLGNMEAVASIYRGQTIDYEGLEQFALDELNRIDEAYAELRKQTGIADLDDLAQNPKFFTADKEQARTSFDKAFDRAQQSASSYFYTYEVDRIGPIVDERCHRFKAAASYGLEHVRLYMCGEKYNMKRNLFLAAHEYYPGHHLQYSQLGKFEFCPGRHQTSMSYSEGWASYAEYLLADKFSQDPDQRLGWLDYRRVRALRILIDTPLKRDDADKDQLREIWRAHMPVRLYGAFENEYFRITNSRNFQHLRYLMGAHAIMDVKNRLEREMGEKFDEKHFHHIMLNGPIRINPYLYEQLVAALEVEAPELQALRSAN
ncbi:MAG: DUF885 family protein [Hellea sp.]|nr:DUF885 family protein [Hellea sp.]